ncbi:MAG: hypothetical protein WC162_02780 [Sphaerochaetaceae bacterium]|nr:hypothetical protein [Sphaerochaetaceae bacterium]
MKPTLLVLAAGMGSRYGGVKQIDSVGRNGETLLDFGVYDAKKSGFSKVVFVIRKEIEKDFRERLFDRIARNMDAEYVFQGLDSLLTEKQKELSKGRTKPWGTVHAVLCAKKEVKTPFAVINSDDYYGREAYSILGNYLSSIDNDSTKYSMVGYKLKNTMSPIGSVSRGVCKVKDDLLVSMRENTKIEYRLDGSIVSHLPEGDVDLTGDEWVSMNFFGFTPEVFNYFGSYFDGFIKENITTEKGESLLPNCSSEIVTKNKGSISFFTTDEKWFGMTYKEDREVVRTNLNKKINIGYYPEVLWKR